MTCLRRIRTMLLVAVLALCSLGALCNLNLPQAPPAPSGPATVHVIAWAPRGGRASGVQMQLKRWQQCANFFGCFPASFVETRTALSSARGDVRFENVTPGFWRLAVIGSDEWSPDRGGGDFSVSAGGTVEQHIWVQPRVPQSRSEPVPP